MRDKALQDYLIGNRACPYCTKPASGDPEGDILDYESNNEGTLHVERICKACGKAWIDLYDRQAITGTTERGLIHKIARDNCRCREAGK